MDDTLFKLRITAFTPATIPMNRLAEYMLQFASLMGNESHVHFKGALKGSTVLCASVEHEDVPKVSERLAKIHLSSAPADIIRPFDTLNGMLRVDNARATLKHGSAKIIKFPGCDAPVAQRIGPVKEAGQLEGMVISVGGKDNTKHIRLLGHDGEECKVTTRNVELAKQLGNNLFSNVRVAGMGTWYRSEDGKWELENFIAQNCEPLENCSLVEAIAGLREIEGDEWKTLPDPLAVWQDLRRN